MTLTKNLSPLVTVIGLVMANGAYAQISTINSAVVQTHVFNDVPSATPGTINNYPSLTLGESGVSAASGFADRDRWYFSSDGSNPYQFRASDYFSATFNLTLTGNNPNGKDLEAGFLFSDPSGSWGGDLQSIVVGNNGAVVQFGGPSYYPFSPAAGGYPHFTGAPNVPNYTMGATYAMGLTYTIDPGTGNNAFEYSVNGVYAESSAGNRYFDLGPGVSIGADGDFLGGYLQVQNDSTNPNQSGQAVFGNISIQSVPEPGTLALLAAGFGLFGLVARRNRR